MRGALVTAAIALFTLPGCGLLERPGEDEEALLDWACTNSIGWLLTPSDRAHYANNATEAWIEANRAPPEEDWDDTLAITENLIGWYDSENEVAVRAFVDENDCFNRVGADRGS